MGTEAVARIVDEPEYYFGLDLGKAHDYTALATIERSRWVFPFERDRVTMEFRRETRHLVREVERVPLATPYPDVVSFVKERMRRVGKRKATLVVDATGVGAPVVDLLRRERLACHLVPVVITGGLAESMQGPMRTAPKRDLMVGLQVAFEKRWLRLGRCALRAELVAELSAVQMRRGLAGHERYGAATGHDDLVMAVALGWWWLRRCWPRG
jgi:hypothetical protein